MRQPIGRIAVMVGALLFSVGTAAAGAPLKGIDVKLGKNPGGMVASRTTDSSGAFSFGVLPVGRYRLTISFPTGIALAPGTLAEVIIKGAVGGAIDLKLAPPASGAVAAVRAADASTAFRSDGIRPVSGTIQFATTRGSNGRHADMAVKGAGVSGGAVPTGGSSGPTKDRCVPYPGRPCP